MIYSLLMYVCILCVYIFGKSCHISQNALLKARDLCVVCLQYFTLMAPVHGSPHTAPQHKIDQDDADRQVSSYN